MCPDGKRLVGTEWLVAPAFGCGAAGYAESLVGDDLAFQAFGVRKQLAAISPVRFVLRDIGFNRVELASFRVGGSSYGSFGALADLSGEQVAMVFQRAA
jgi:hypothetical protein